MAQRARLLVALSVLALPCIAHSQSIVNGTDGIGAGPATFGVITPVFGQLVYFTLPATFVHGFENVTAKQYIHEFVPRGESVEKWTQLIKLVGLKDLVGEVDLTPKKLMERFAGQYKAACTGQMAAQGLGPTTLGSHEAFVAVVACGNTSFGGFPHREAAMIMAIGGTGDYYTLNWSERGEATDDMPDLDIPKWLARYKLWKPIRLCPIVPGEQAPYPSCIPPSVK